MRAPTAWIFLLLLVSATGAQAFDGALVMRTSNQSVVSGDSIVWQASSYEEGGNWWRSATQPQRLYVVNGVSKVKVRFSVTLAGASTGRMCAFAAYFKANGQRQFVPGIAANCVNADNIGTTEIAVHSAAMKVSPGDYFEFAVNIHPGSLAPLTANGTFGVTWAAIEKVE